MPHDYHSSHKSKLHRKIVSAVKHDDDVALGKILRKNSHLDIGAIKLNSRKQRPLHLACSLGRWKAVKFMIQSRFPAGKLDMKGNIALYYAIKTALQMSKMEIVILREVYDSVIEPLARRSGTAVNVVNKKGRSAGQLLDMLKTELVEDDIVSTDSDSDSDIDDWYDNIAAECFDEYMSSWGDYERDYQYTSREQESYDEWADRLFSERRHKQKSTHTNFQSGSSSQKSKPQPSWSAKDQEEFEKREQENQKKRQTDVFAEKKESYCRKCCVLFSKECHDIITTAHLPFNSGEDERQILDIIFYAEPDIKRQVRRQQLLWHPDKFMQHCGARLKEEDKDAIMQRVTMISQSLNNYWAQVKKS